MTEAPATPRIVAVVVTFNRLALLQRLVPRLLETEGLAEILVVDNASTDGTGEWLASQPAPVVPMTLPDNRGGAGRLPRRPGRRGRPAGPTWSG